MNTPQETQFHEESAYVLTPIPNKVRYVKAAASVLISFALAVWGWWSEYHNNELHDKWFYLLAIPAFGLWLGAKIYRQTERRHLAFTIQNIPLKDRVEKAGAIAFWTLAICLLVWYIQYPNQLREYWWYVWPFAIPGLSWSLFELFRLRKRVLTPIAEAEYLRLEKQNLAKKLAKEAEAKQREAEMESKWYYRYPMAALALAGGLWIVNEKDDLWWVTMVLAIFAAFKAWELSLLALTIGGIYLIFKAIAELPVSVAIIIGAIIIAGASRR